MTLGRVLLLLTFVKLTARDRQAAVPSVDGVNLCAVAVELDLVEVGAFGGWIAQRGELRLEKPGNDLTLWCSSLLMASASSRAFCLDRYLSSRIQPAWCGSFRASTMMKPPSCSLQTHDVRKRDRPASREAAKALAAELLKTAGPERLFWGSEWPFAAYEDKVTYSDTNWIPDPAARRKIGGETAFKFCFG